MSLLKKLFASAAQRQYAKELECIKGFVLAAEHKMAKTGVHRESIVFESELDSLIAELKTAVLNHDGLRSKTFDAQLIRRNCFSAMVNSLDTKLSSGRFHVHLGTLDFRGEALRHILKITLPMLIEYGVVESTDDIEKNIAASIAGAG